MSQKNVVIGLILAAATIAAGTYYLHKSTQEDQTASAGSVEITSLPSGSRTDDASLSQDLSSIDAQMHAANTDVSSADASARAAAQ